MSGCFSAKLRWEFAPIAAARYEMALHMCDNLVKRGWFGGDHQIGEYSSDVAKNDNSEKIPSNGFSNSQQASSDAVINNRTTMMTKAVKAATCT